MPSRYSSCESVQLLSASDYLTLRKISFSTVRTIPSRRGPRMLICNTARLNGHQTTSLASAARRGSRASRRELGCRVCCMGESSSQQVDEAAASSAGSEAAANSSRPKQSAPVPGEANKSDAEKKVSSFVKNTASTFAPRASVATKNPAYKGSTLYAIFGAQAWVSILVGGLLSYNVIFPTDQPSIARLMGMWSVWMFTVPALRARECSATEKEALNLLFLLIPLLNVTLPFVWKSFPFIFTADCAALGAVYLWKVGLPGRQQETT